MGGRVREWIVRRLVGVHVVVAVMFVGFGVVYLVIGEWVAGVASLVAAVAFVSAALSAHTAAVWRGLAYENDVARREALAELRDVYGFD